MFGLTIIGFLHTALSVGALACACLALATRGLLSNASLSGQNYLFLTVCAAITAFRVHEPLVFGPGHVLAAMTLVTVVVIFLSTGTELFGGSWRTIELIGMNVTLFFHGLAASAEVLSRVPPGAPLVDSLESPLLLAVQAALLVACLLLTHRQLQRLKATASPTIPT